MSVDYQIGESPCQKSERSVLPMQFAAGLSPAQKAYVLKLGECKGREIVPINLDLYRQLIKLELVVDKGRRLALSSLGKQVLYCLKQLDSAVV